MGEWISIKDEMPEPFLEVLVCYRFKSDLDNEDMALGHWNDLYRDGKWYFQADLSDEGDIQVTHWMPLPELPEENNYVDDKC